MKLTRFLYLGNNTSRCQKAKAKKYLCHKKLPEQKFVNSKYKTATLKQFSKQELKVNLKARS